MCAPCPTGTFSPFQDHRNTECITQPALNCDAGFKPAEPFVAGGNIDATTGATGPRTCVQCPVSEPCDAPTAGLAVATDSPAAADSPAAGDNNGDVDSRIIYAIVASIGACFIVVAALL